jgi:rhodanese-related sulfurtransferase
LHKYEKILTKIMTISLVLTSLAVMSVSCTGTTGKTYYFTPSAVPNVTSGATGTTTTPKPSEATSSPIKTSETPVKTTPTKTPAVLTPPSPKELAEGNFVLPEIPRILCEQLKQMMDSSGDFVLVDTRKDASFKIDHLPGAVNTSKYNSTQEMVASQLAAISEKKLVIFYCDCPDDIESANMAQQLIQMRSGDQSNVKVLWKGYYRWLELGYPTIK